MTSEATDHEFESLLEYLNRSRGFDFQGYKRASLMRRIEKRMQQINLAHYSDYVDYLEVHPEEFEYLFNTILINVTAFFRDASSWEYLASEVLPRLVASKSREDPIRVWSAGCASGEEAYSLAILFTEALGPEAFRERVKIYGTDIDAEALNQARQATYTAKQVEEVSAVFLEKYFERLGERYIFNRELRSSVIFGRHDLMQDAPISRLGLLVCRNTLMYFNAEAQARILERFHFALNEGGYLFLGKAEMLLTQTNSFTPSDLKRRVFIKVPRDNTRERAPAVPRTTSETPSAVNPLLDHVRIRETAFDTGPVPQLVVDLKGVVVLINAAARFQFGLSARDLGRPFHDLEVSFRPVELRSCIEQVNKEQQPVILRQVEWRKTSAEVAYLDVHVTPLSDNGSPLGTAIRFTDVTPQKQLQEELQRSHQEREEAYEELQSTNEELETTNEELQSTVEEVQTTNEELQSTNEELETMNEEMQSANEELQTINEELRQRSDELNQVNAFLESITSSLRAGAAVLDRDLLVRLWNPRAEDLWGLRADEVRGKHFLNLDIGLPVAQLQQSLRTCLGNGAANQEEVFVDAVNRRGRAIKCKVVCNPLHSANGDRSGVIVLMEEQDGSTEA